jgi:YbbR domain-containing protein
VRIPVSSFKTLWEYIKALRNNRRLGIFLIFLALSTIFWFLTQLEEVYVTRISYPVEYQDMPEDKIVVGNLPSHMRLEIRGQGFKLLEYKFSNELNPLILHINSYNLQALEDDDSPRYYIVTQSTATRIAQQLSQEVEILDIKPDTLFFEFAEKINKKVPVQPSLQYTFARQMMLGGTIQIEPDSVTITGPNSVLDTIFQIPTHAKTYTDLQRTVHASIALEKPHEQVELSTRRVELTIPVEQYTEGEVQKDVQVINVPDSVVVKTFPQNVTITYLVGLSQYQKVIPELFRVVADYQDIKEGGGQLKVEVMKAPDYLKSYSYNPREVDYIIEKKE